MTSRRLLLSLNAVLLASLTLNVTSRLGYSDHLSSMSWRPEGCIQPKSPSYDPIEYGDRIDLNNSQLWQQTRIGDNSGPVPVHLVLVPYLGENDLREIERYCERFSLTAEYGMQTVVSLYGPNGVSVPSRGWRIARSWVKKFDHPVVFDPSASLFMDFKIDPCECLYQVVWDREGIVKWAGRGQLENREYWELLIDVAKGLR